MTQTLTLTEAPNVIVRLGGESLQPLVSATMNAHFMIPTQSTAWKKTTVLANNSLLRLTPESA